MERSINNEGRDVYELNLAYLFCLREMARKDVTEAAVRFGIDQTLAQTIAEASIDRIRSIADASMLQFKMRAPNQVRSLIRDTDGPAKLLNAISLISEAADNE
jgi:hypothetical protein